MRTPRSEGPVDRAAPSSATGGHGDSADLDEVTDVLSSSFGGPPGFVVPIGPAVETHVGTEAVVVGVMAGAAR